MNQQTVQHHTIEESDQDKRLDNYLIRVLKNVPKSRIYRMIRSGEVRVNKGRCKAGMHLKVDDLVRIPPLFMEEKDAPKIPLSAIEQIRKCVLYEDDHLLIINKPAGIAVHGGTGIAFGLIETLWQHPPWGKAELAHRLDRDTSGCLLIAKKAQCLKLLHVLLRQHSIKKEYTAVVHGRWPKKLTTIDLPLKKFSAANGERFVRVHPEGKPSITHFKVLAQNISSSLLEINLETGRTHQIRVHCHHAGHPIIGDAKYTDKTAYQVKEKKRKSKDLKGLMLHAGSLKFRHPFTDKTIEIDAPLPIKFQQFINNNLAYPLQKK